MLGQKPIMYFQLCFPIDNLKKLHAIILLYNFDEKCFINVERGEINHEFKGGISDPKQDE